MKKILFLFFVFLSQFLSYSQYKLPSSKEEISRGVLAELMFNLIYGENTDVYDYDAANFPNPFLDLQENTEQNTKLKVLSYLQYDNGLTVYNYFNKPTASFKIHSKITKFEALLYIMEAWNIAPDFSRTSTPYSDIPNTSLFTGYINGAYKHGIIQGSGKFYPFSYLTEDDTVQIIYRVLNNPRLHPVKEDLSDIKNYFIPSNYSPQNLSQFKGLNQGVFNHYAKNSFVIPDRKMNLNFSHFYSTQMVELPDGYFPIKPLGRGWTHTYNSYVILEENVIGNEDVYNIVWPDGTIHLYNEKKKEYISKGVYDEFYKRSSRELRITKKDQTRYTYKKLDSDRPIYYLIEIEDSNGNEIEIDYESAEEKDTRRIDWVKAPSGKKLHFRYISNSDLIERVTDPIGRKIYFEYSDLWKGYYKTLVGFDDAKSNTTTYQYYIDKKARQYLLRRIDLPKGNKIEAQYDNRNNGKLERYIVNGNKATEVDLDFKYGSSRPLRSKVKVPMPEGGDQNFRFEYNRNGALTRYRNDTDDIKIDYPTSNSSPTPFLPSHTSTNGLDIEYDYDRRGNVTKIDIENGKSIKRYRYDSDNNVTEYTDPEGSVTKFKYDSDENLIEIEDAYGNTIDFKYDRYGQLTSVTNQEGITIAYTYENDGAVSSINAPEGISATFDYDEINRLLRKRVNGLTTRYRYDKNDNITSFTDTGGYTTSYDYDKNDNLTTITNAKGVKTAFYYNDKDQVTSEKFANLETRYRYNDDGSLDRLTKPSNNRVNYKYDKEGRLKETGTITDIDYNSRNLIEDITNQTGKIVFKYDKLNRPDKITTVHGYKVEYDYEKTGLVEEIEYPTINGVELEVRYNYDKKNRLRYIQLERNVGENGILLSEYEYYKDDRLRRTDFANNTRNLYLYDDAGRLNHIHSVNRNQGALIIYDGKLTLDERGNILKEEEKFQPIGAGYGPNGSGSENNDYSYNHNNHAQYIDGTRHYVNRDGNTVKIGSNEDFVYNINDQLVNYTNVDNTHDFKYNPYNQRVQATRNGTTTKYIRDVLTDNVLVALDENNNPIYYYIYTPHGQLVARMNTVGELQYYHADVRGSTVAITNDNAEITHQYRYDDFGSLKRVREPENDFNPYRYVGTYGVEYETNDLYYMRARYYKPSVGRFLTEDPVWHTNLYPYADNNPISRVDPLGKDSFFSNEWLANKFYENGYGDAVNLLSQENEAWDFALNNPEISGGIIGLGAAAAAVGITYGGLGIANLISNGSKFTYQFTISQGLKSGGLAYGGVTSPIKGQKLFQSLGKVEDGDNSYIKPAIVNGAMLISPLYRFNKKLLNNYSHYAR
ncbi:conserved protein of unknown function [Tenacibaculum sp. 190524A02b]|uniref:RHS repeat-associated core domain-containing protein n=1 Tax=Tenacibaculum vairaonense TaxID=3137860 RepID=UPI0032B163FD